MKRDKHIEVHAWKTGRAKHTPSQVPGCRGPGKYLKLLLEVSTSAREKS
jgi:hypothetical protein